MSTRPVILMTDPTHYGVSYEINPWMRPDVWGGAANRHLIWAQKAWAQLKLRLELAGATVHVAQGAPGLPDMVFPANAAIVLNGRALMAMFRHPERAEEEAPFLAAFDDLRRSGVLSDVTPNPGIFQEGAGDCIWDAARRLFWVGSGPRSEPSSVGMIAEHFGEETVGLPLASERYYHLDTCFCPLPGGEILLHPPALTDAALRAVRERVSPDLIIEAEEQDAERFCVNAVALGRTLVMAKPSDRLERRLAERGYRVAAVDVSPFILAGGGAFCMTLRLDLTSPDISSDQSSTADHKALAEVYS